MRAHLIHRATWLSLPLVLALPAHAQTDAPAQPAAPAPTPAPAVPNVGDLVKPAAEAPGFEALGKSGSDISYPGSVRTLAAGVLNGLDQNGDFNTGLAFQFSPYLLANGHDLDGKTYRRDQMLARFSLTAATAKAAESEKGLSASLGFTWMPIAGDDPYGDDTLATCVHKALVDAVDPDADTISGSTNDKLKACNDDFEKKGKVNIQLGGAAIFFSPTGKTNDLTAKGVYATAVARYTLPARNMSLVAAAAYRSHEPVPDPATKGAFFERNRLSLGGRLVFGNGKTSIFGVEAAYQRADYNHGTTGRDDYVTYVGSVSVKMSDDLWVNFRAGGSSGHRRDGNPGFFGTSLTWGSKPAIKAPGAGN